MTADPGASGPGRHPRPRRRLPLASRYEGGFELGLWFARGVVLLPVLVLVLASLGAFVYGAEVFARSAHRVFVHPEPVGNNIGYFLLVIDLFLVGATMLIAAIGFYELFISRVDPRGMSQLPVWLQMGDLNDLKARVLAMIVLVSAVTFAELLVDVRYHNGLRLLRVGVAIAVVVLSLTAFMRFGAGMANEHRSGHHVQSPEGD